MEAAVVITLVLALIVVVGIVIVVILATKKKNKVYTITYNLNGGHIEAYSYNNENPTSYTIESETITLKAPTQCGYEFEGWTEGNDETLKTTVKIPKGSTGNKTFTAHFKAKKLNVDTTPGGKFCEYFGINDDNELSIRRISFDGSFTVPSDMLKDFECSGWKYVFDSIVGYRNCEENDIITAYSSCKKNIVTLTIKNNQIEVPNDVTIIGVMYKGGTQYYPYSQTIFPSGFNSTVAYKHPFSNICVNDYTKVAVSSSSSTSTDSAVAIYDNQMTYTWIGNPFPVDKVNALYFDYVCLKDNNYDTPYYAEYKGTGSDGFLFFFTKISPKFAINFIGKNGIQYYTLIVMYNSSGKVLKEYPELKDGKRYNEDLQQVKSIRFNHTSRVTSYIRFMYYTGTNYTGPFFSAFELKNMGIID